MQRKQWGETAEAYGYGLATGRQLLARQLERSHKENWLRDLQEMQDRQPLRWQSWPNTKMPPPRWSAGAPASWPRRCSAVGATSNSCLNAAIKTSTGAIASRGGRRRSG